VEHQAVATTSIDVFWFQVQNIGLALLVLALFVRQSIRQKRVTPFLAMSIAILSISWMEAPFDWTMWCQFNPALTRFPAWGPLALTSGGLPVMNPFGYIFFLAIPVALSAVIARWVLGAIWDYPNQILGIKAGWWRYARGLQGLTVNAGTPYTYSLGETFFMSTFLMIMTYCVARRDGQDRTQMEIWADRNARGRVGRAFANILACIVIAHAVYAILFIPFLIAKLGNLQTAAYTGPLFKGLPPQPGPPPNPANGWLGIVVIIGLEGAFLVIFVATVLRKDPLAHGAYPADAQRLGDQIGGRRHQPA
jgi:Spirocyclase AveC-like